MVLQPVQETWKDMSLPAIHMMIAGPARRCGARAPRNTSGSRWDGWYKTAEGFWVKNEHKTQIFWKGTHANSICLFFFPNELRSSKLIYKGRIQGIKTPQQLSFNAAGQSRSIAKRHWQKGFALASQSLQQGQQFFDDICLVVLPVLLYIEKWEVVCGKLTCYDLLALSSIY